MLKRMLVLFVVSQIVVSGDDIPNDEPSNMSGGYVSSISAENYSVFRQIVSCDQIAAIKALVEELKSTSALVAEIDKIRKDPNDKSKCYIYFKSSFGLDVDLKNAFSPEANIKSGEDSIVKSITTLHKELIAKKNNCIDKVDADDFIYDAKTKFYFFANYARLVEFYEDGSKKQTLNGGQAANVLKKMTDIKDFSQWGKSIYNLDTPFDDYKVSENEFNNLDSPKQHADVGNENDSVKVEVVKKNEKWAVKSTLNSNVDSFDFDGKSELFAVYLCQNSGKDDNLCINLKGNEADTNMVWNYKVKPNQRVEVDIREASSLDQYYKLKFYKVFIILTDISRMKIVPKNKYQRQNVLDVKKNDFILIDQGTEEFILKDLQDESRTLYLQIKSKALKIKADDEKEVELFRISLSAIEKKVSDFSNIKFKYYIVRIPSSNILILNDEKDNQAANLQSFKPGKESATLSFNSCNSDSLILKDGEPQNKQNIFLDKEEKTYSCVVNLKTKSESILFSKLETDCIKLLDNSDFQTYRSYYIKDSKNFAWNFNTEPKVDENKNNKCSISIEPTYSSPAPAFKSKTFEFPQHQYYRVFLSISKQNGKSDFTIKGYHFGPEKRLLQIFYSVQKKSIDLTSKNMPETLFYHTKDQRTLLKGQEIEFLEQKVNYQSSTEVIYSFDINDLESCTKELDLYIKDEKLLLVCMKPSENNKNDNGNMSTEQVDYSKLSQGMKKIFDQTAANRNLLI